MRVRVATVCAALTVLLGACGSHTAARTHAKVTPTRDPPTVRALLRIAQQFNVDYAENRDASVYARWDAQSQAIISRSKYIRLHHECGSGAAAGTVAGAVRRGQWWLVNHDISGTNLVDYWRYVQGRWVFDLPRSNPQAVKLYRLSPARYLTAAGCR